MCLSVPMKVDAIDGNRAKCSALGEERWVDLTLMAEEPPQVGAYVIVQSKFAQRTVPEEDALKSYELFGEILRVLDQSAS